MRNLLYLLALLVSNTMAQTISSAQQKALNNYIDYANQSAQEVEAVVNGIRDYYPHALRAAEGKRDYYTRYACTVQLEPYYLKTAHDESKALGSYASGIESKLNALKEAADAIDKLCKSLDTYHKLEDYKQDNYKGAIDQIKNLPALLVAYTQAQGALDKELHAAFRKLQPYISANAYHAADAMMRESLDNERAFIDLWKINLHNQVHTGWVVQALEASILDTDVRAKKFTAKTPAVKYPASSMVSSFGEGLSSILETKRKGLDGYNTEAKKSDEHSNQVYDYLVNYYNGVLVSFYNNYFTYTGSDGYRGLKAMRYVTMVEIRSAQVSAPVVVKPFDDAPRRPVVPTPQKIVISRQVYQGLDNYIGFINETWRQVRILQSAISSFSSSAASLKKSENYERRAPLHFDYKNFELPRSQYQKAIAESKAIPALFSATLNEQLTVLMNIMKEMDAIGAAIDEEVSTRKYEQDRLDNVYKLMERAAILFEIWDERKELLYTDVRTAFDSYQPDSPAGSWYKSGMALHKLTDLDRNALFKVRDYYRGGERPAIHTAEIDAELRNIIASEYDNMNGIKRLGRNNGLCPYTPYEDLPKTSRALVEGLQQLKPPSSNLYNHPYHTLVYHYNDIVDDHNKFCELSEAILLKTVKQPELFSIQYPDREDDPVKQNQPTPDAVPPTNVPTQQRPEGPRNTAGTTTVLRDTVVIEKHDTVYIRETDENLRSMEGYAINNMVLLLDVSGSMNAPDKLPLLKTAVLSMLTMMREQDEVSIVVYSGRAKVLLSPTSFRDEEKVRSVIEKLRSEGKTDGNAGLKLAYKVADDNYVRGGNNRIVLATDGEFPISNESYENVQKYAGEDIFISVFNFGKSNTSAKSLEKLAAAGKGNYEFITKENAEIKLIHEAKSKRER